MPPASLQPATPLVPFSPLILSDRLITLAKDADRAGYPDTAEQLITLACSVLDQAPYPPH